MKFISKMLISTTALLLAGNLYAITCPPVNMIQNAKFIKASSLNDHNPNAWGMITNNFEFDGNTWNGVLVVKLKDAKTENEALIQGQNYFKKITLKAPKIQNYKDRTECKYGSESNEYLVGTITPPLVLPPPNQTSNLNKK